MNPFPLMYHDITAPGGEDASGFPGGDAARYKLTLAQFDAHLHAIAQRVSRAPVLTFDDGGVSAMMIAEKLEAVGWRGQFFVTAGYIDRNRFLTRADIRDLHTRGHVIGSHSWSHPLRMAHCTPRRIAEEWTRSIAALSGVLGEAVVTASVPGGGYSRLVADAAAAAGVTLLYISQPTGSVRHAGSLVVAGRYVVQRSTPATRAAAVAAGAVLPRVQQLTWWNLKAVGKTIGGPAYLRVRDKLLGRSDHVTWGDEITTLSEDPS